MKEIMYDKYSVMNGQYTNYISRSKDLETWEMGKYNPILMPSNEDKNISPNMRNVTEKDLERIRTGYNINNSDIDMCDWQGKTYITYACGNQQGNSWNAMRYMMLQWKSC